MYKRLIYLLMIVALVVGIFSLAYINLKALTAKFIVTTSIQNQNNFAVLLLGEAGKGQGGQWEQAPNLTDAIILVQFIPKSNVVNLVSIPRDLYGTFGTSTLKVNEALERNDLSGLIGKLPDMTGIGTDKFAVVDLSLVQSIVNNLGGIDVNLPSTVTDSVSGFSMTAGLHHLSGSDVDWLIRNRFAPQGDFFREDNQHLIIEAIAKKFLGLSFIDQAKFVVALSPQINNLDTNVSLSQVYPLVSAGNNLTFRSAVFGFSTGLVESSSTPTNKGLKYILVPTAGVNNYSKIRSYIIQQLQPPQAPRQNP